MAKGWRGASYEGEPCSLGWDLVDLAEATLRVPSGPDTGKPLVLADWQAEIVVRMYAVNPRSGRFVYERLYLEAIKGSGKSPMGAVLAFLELVGPVMFDGFDAQGEPVGRPRQAPWLQMAAVAEDQTENVYGAFRQMLAESPAIADYGIDLGLTRVYLTGRPGKVEPVTSAAGTREGQPITFALLDEPWLWTPQNSGKKLAATLRRNVAKMGGRWAELTNAFEPGVGSVAEETAKAAEKDRSILVVRWEAPPVKDAKDPVELRPALAKVYERCPWVDVESVLSYCLAPDTDPVEVRRFFLNHRVAAEARLFPEDLLRERVLPGELLEDREPLAVGFDGSLRRDATAIVGVHMVTGRAYLLGFWQRGLLDSREWEVPRGDVMETLAVIFDRWQVAKNLWDPAYWREEMATCQQLYGKDRVRPFGTTSNRQIHEAIEAMESALRGATLVIDGGCDEDGSPHDEAKAAIFVQHLQAAHVTYQTVGSRRFKNVAKPDDGRRIDAAAALLYAHTARLEALRDGWAPKVAPVPYITVR